MRFPMCIPNCVLCNQNLHKNNLKNMQKGCSASHPFPNLKGEKKMTDRAAVNQAVQDGVSNVQLRAALKLIKMHITSENNQQNYDLHTAVQMIVSVARQNGLLLDSPSSITTNYL